MRWYITNDSSVVNLSRMIKIRQVIINLMTIE